MYTYWVKSQPIIGQIFKFYCSLEGNDDMSLQTTKFWCLYFLVESDFDLTNFEDIPPGLGIKTALQVWTMIKKRP